MKRTAKAVWKGTGKEGTGSLDTQSGAFNGQPYSFRTRFENEDGKLGTNPEELIAASHAGCFCMALSFQLNGAGFTADELNCDAHLTMENEGVHWSITKIHLDLKAKVPGIDEAQFNELANNARDTCPISKVLNCEITLSTALN